MKQESDTPRTDALIPSQSFVDQTRLFDREWFVPLLALARQLERELSAFVGKERQEDGYVRVPVEPTAAMEDAMHKANDDFSNNRFYGKGHLSRGEFIYQAMLEAASKGEGNA